MIHDDNEPLIGIPFFENGREVVHYFFSDAEADAATGEQAVQDALALAGCWSDLDSDDMLERLDRIRHHSDPTSENETNLEKWIDC